jgi:hypothetical protein
MISGAMQCNDTQIVDIIPFVGIGRASLKSATLMHVSEQTKMLSGFRSRCAKPPSCRHYNAFRS